MADKASADRIAADMQPPNFRAAVQLIRHAIEKKKTKISEINGEISDQWSKVEGHKVNKKAGRIFSVLDKLEHEERVDIMRSLNGLMDAAGWAETEGDLVDKATGNVVHLRAGRAAAQQDDGDDDDNGGEDGSDMAEIEAAIAEPAKPRRGRKPAEPGKADAETGVANAAAAARDRIRGALGAKPDEQEAYTGDNSDLAGE